MKENADDDLKQLVLKVLMEKDDWSKHISHTCKKCENCNCGKHKCKFTPVKINMKPSTSTYKACTFYDI